MMGLYHTLGRIQLKCGPDPDGLPTYRIGDSVPFDDGVYVGYEGVGVVVGGKFVAEFPALTDKYGGSLDVQEIIDRRNPLNPLRSKP